MDIAQELLNLKNKIESMKTEASRVEGQIEQLQKQRAEEFGCSSDEEAEEYIDELSEKIDELKSEIEFGIKTIKEELGW